MLTDSLTYVLISSVFTVAFLYASVGHGGASGYIATLTLLGVSSTQIKPTALVLNICVALIAFAAFHKKGYFRKDVFIPLALTSVPAAFLAGTFQLEIQFFRIGIALVLMISAIQLFGLLKSKTETHRIEPSKFHLMISGLMIGTASGLLGIGGGILLSPLLILLRWASVKETAALSALFIFVNSLSGLAGTLIVASRAFHFQLMLPELFASLLGGFLGSRMGAGIIQASSLRKLLAFVLMLASIKLIFV